MDTSISDSGRGYGPAGVTVLPGSYIARERDGTNPGAGRVRMALVAETAECVEAAERVVRFVRQNFS